MLRTKDLHTTGMSFSYLLGEIEELIEEILSMNIKGIISESCDIWTCFLCWITEITGLNVPILWEKTGRSWLIRFEYWDIIFKLNNLKFDHKYLCKGGNWYKPHKQITALNLAKKDQL